LSTRDENISSPRGFVAGGIGGIGTEVDRDWEALREWEGDEGGEREVSATLDGGSSGRGKKKARGLK